MQTQANEFIFNNVWVIVVSDSLSSMDVLCSFLTDCGGNWFSGSIVRIMQKCCFTRYTLVWSQPVSNALIVTDSPWSFPMIVLIDIDASLLCRFFRNTHTSHGERGEVEIDLVDKDYRPHVAHILGSRLPNLQQICMDRPHCSAWASRNWHASNTIQG